MSTYRNQADGIPVIDKAPVAVLDYIVDLAAEEPGPWLEDGETIVTASAVASSGLSVVVATPAPFGAATRIVVWLSDGTLGMTHLVTVRFTTSREREDERSFRVRVVQR